MKTYEYKDLELLKNFLLEQFDFNDLKKCGLLSKEIKKTDYEKQANRICEYFGFDNIFQYGFNEVKAHITYVEGQRPIKEPFVTIIKPWHES